MQFIFEQLRMGGDRNFGYLIGDRKAGEAIVIDPSYAPEILTERARAQGLRITHILNTHGHGDHANGNAEARKQTGARVHAGPGAGGDVTLKDGTSIKVGTFDIRVWHVPGHCPDHLAFFVDRLNVGITGDLLFVGKVGGTHSEADGRTEWQSLQRLLRDWPDDTTIWPGHDYGARPSTTIALEKITNPSTLQALGVGISVMILSIIVTVILLAIQRYVIKKTNSTAIRADALHYATDLLTNTSTVAALFLAGLGWDYADPIFSVFIALIILKSAWTIGNDAINLLIFWSVRPLS